MKRESLRIRNLNIKRSNSVDLKDISFCLMQGESTGFLGLDNSGKDTLMKVLYGDDWPESGEIQIEGKKINNSEEMKQYVHRIMDINYAIADWTVAEYIGLVDEHFWPMILHQKRLRNDIKTLLNELEIGISPDKKLSELTELEKRVIDIAKAYKKQAKILIIEDVFEGVPTEDIRAVKTTLDRVIKHKMTAIINTYSDNLNEILSDCFIIFYKGIIVKKCSKDEIKDKAQLETLLLGSKRASKYWNYKNFSNEKSNNFEEVYAAKNILLEKGVSMDFSIGRGEVVSLLDMNTKEKVKIFNTLSGREVDKSVALYLEQKPVTLNTIADFVKNKIVSGVHLGDFNELLTKMSVGENILIPSLNKIPSFKYMRYGTSMLEMLETQIQKDKGTAKKLMIKKESNDRIMIMLERWYVYKPKVIVLLEPFIQCDVNGIALIKSYINKFASSGIAVIILKSRENDIEDISNRIIKIN